MNHLVLSYPESERHQAALLTRGLAQADLVVWSQADGRLPSGGAHPVDHVRKEIATSSGLLLLVTSGGLTRWQDAELHWSRSIQASNPHHLILPVLLGAGARSQLPTSLAEATALELPGELEGLSKETWAVIVARILDIRSSLTDRLSGKMRAIVRPSPALEWSKKMREACEESLVSPELGYPVIEEVCVESDPCSGSLGAVTEEDLLLLTIHGGRCVPAHFMPDGWKAQRNVERDYEIEKDWGSNQLAWALAAKLGLESYRRVNTARVLMDFGRFPGTTGRHADHMNRHAISGIFSGILDHKGKRTLLNDHYDRISDHLEPLVSSRKLMLTIHTYDKLNYPARTKRPPISLIHTPIGYHRNKTMPFGVFDPLYPDELAESTADRELVARLALAFESLGEQDYKRFLGGSWDGSRFRVAFNHPYYMPDGSLEVRAQVWHFFDWLKTAFEKGSPSSCDEAAFKLVWKMLMDTNLRKSDTVALRGFLHMYRDPPEGSLLYYDEAAGGPTVEQVRAADVMDAYKAIEAFVKKDGHEAVRRYRRSDGRLNALTLEVRKDLLWRFQESPWSDEGRPVARTDPDALRVGNINFIAEVLAGALSGYFTDGKDAGD